MGLRRVYETDDVGGAWGVIIGVVVVVGLAGRLCSSSSPRSLPNYGQLTKGFEVEVATTRNTRDMENGKTKIPAWLVCEREGIAGDTGDGGNWATKYPGVARSYKS